MPPKVFKDCGAAFGVIAAPTTNGVAMVTPSSVNSPRLMPSPSSLY
ncbi:MAG: hypothetical protein ACR2F2_10880 [Pyrinomonadaceae bacterium]